MKINVYYGGRGIVGDPTLFVLSKMQTVLEELNVRVDRINLYDEKRNITTLPSTLNDADGVILASTVEWYGIGGYLLEFLDACWFYGNKQKIADIYMCPVVMSTTYGERNGILTLQSAWDMLGGKPISGISAYVKDPVAFELNQEYVNVIEKAAENLYRSISRKAIMLPASNQAVKQMVSAQTQIDLTPQETEQLSRYASDDNYVQTQKEDIKELTTHFKNLLKNDGKSEEDMALQGFQGHFKPQKSYEAIYKFIVKGFDKPLILEVKNAELKSYFGNIDNESVLCRLKKEKLDHIQNGRSSFQKAFMSGDMQVKGDFRMLRMLDEIFVFSETA
ncbi:MAG: SCP2 sterol-binding domain-containing protein [Lachnospiraceae bacterium]|nr:SCP2 sterol-binding domain-containing protein [Lachnospiraceae bacterium]